MLSHVCARLRYTPHFQSPFATFDIDKVIAGLVRARLLSEAVAFISGDKQSIFFCVSVAAPSTGTTLATSLIAEACAALLAVKCPSLSPCATVLTVTSSAALQTGVYLVTAKVTGEQQVQASLQAGSSSNDVPVLCQGTLSCTE